MCPALVSCSRVSAVTPPSRLRPALQDTSLLSARHMRTRTSTPVPRIGFITSLTSPGSPPPHSSHDTLPLWQTASAHPDTAPPVSEPGPIRPQDTERVNSACSNRIPSHCNNIPNDSATRRNYSPRNLARQPPPCSIRTENLNPLLAPSPFVAPCHCLLVANALIMRCCRAYSGFTLLSEFGSIDPVKKLS